MLHPATPADLPLLVTLMREFYQEADFQLTQAQAALPLAALLADEHLGAAYLLLAPEGQPAGYLVLTWCFSLEYGGRRAVLDDFFVRPAYRGSGLGSAALAALPGLCRRHGARAVSVEVGTGGRASQLYRRAGFAPAPGREVLTLTLAAPTHETATPAP